MQVYGVGKNGGFLNVNKDLNVIIRYGDYCYIDSSANQFVYIIPEKRPENYKDGYFEFDEESEIDFDEAPYYGKYKISIAAELKSNKNIDLEDVLSKGMDAVVNQYGGSPLFEGADYKAVRDDSSIKAGYFYAQLNMGLGILRPTIMYIFTNKTWYTVECNFTTIDPEKNDKMVEQFLNDLEIKEAEENDDEHKTDSKSNESNEDKENESIIDTSGLDESIIDGLKLDAENIYKCFSMIGEKLKTKEFSVSEHNDGEEDDDDNDEWDDDLDVDVVTDYIYSLEGINYQNVSYRYAGFRNDFELIYNPTYVIPVDMSEWIFPFDYYVVVRLLDDNGGFDPNLLSKRLVEKIGELDKDKIYKKLVENAIEAINDGKKLESIFSVDYINKQLDEYENKFEVQGTQYEGRNDRIEKIKVGDKLKLFREPDNDHDLNAIELKNRSGSIGHLPWNAANLLSPAIDAGLIKAEAEVVEVTPLSQRSNKAKKALLYVKILINKEDSEDCAVDNKEVDEYSKVELNGSEDVQSQDDSSENDKSEYERLMEKYEKESPIIIEKRNMEIQKSHQELEEELKEELTRLESVFINNRQQIEKEIKEIDASISNLRNELQSLSVFKMGRKKEINEEINRLQEKTATKHSEEMKIINSYELNISTARDACERKKSMIEEKIELENPLPYNPSSVVHRFYITAWSYIGEYKRFNWQKYGVNPIAVIDENIKKEYVNFDIDADLNWHMTDEERENFLEEFKKFISDNDYGSIPNLNLSTSYFLEAETYDGLIISYCIGDDDLQTLKISNEDLIDYGFVKGKFLSYHELSFQGIETILERFGNLSGWEKQMIEDGMA